MSMTSSMFASEFDDEEISKTCICPAEDQTFPMNYTNFYCPIHNPLKRHKPDISSRHKLQTYILQPKEVRHPQQTSHGAPAKTAKSKKSKKKEEEHVEEKRTVEYDPRWPGVKSHVHHGVLVGAGESKGQLMQFEISIKDKTCYGKVHRVAARDLHKQK